TPADGGRTWSRRSPPRWAPRIASTSPERVGCSHKSRPSCRCPGPPVGMGCAFCWIWMRRRGWLASGLRTTTMPPFAAALVGLALLAWPRGGRVGAVLSLGARAPGAEGHGPSSSRRWRGRRLVSRFSLREPAEGTAQWLPLLDELSAALRCGLPPAEALGMALSGSSPTVRTALTPVLQAAREGRPGGPAWTRAA